MMYKFLFAPALILSLSGCLGDIATSSRFFDPAQAGVTPVNVDQNFNYIANESVTEPGIGGASFAIATNGGHAAGYAGVINGSDAGDVITNGRAVYLADYTVETLSGIQFAYGTLQGFGGTDSGSIVLEANFDAATLTGEDASLLVDGVIEGDQLGGEVVYSGLQGQLEGLVGESGVVGAFHGNDAKMVYVGGFAGLRD